MDLKPKTQDDRVGQAVIGRALGVEVRVHDDGSQDGMYDLQFTYSDGRTAAVEVVSNRQEALRSTWNQSRRVGYQPVPELSRVWTVSVHHGTSPMRLKTRLSKLLRDLEDRGLEEVDELDLYDIYDDPEKDWPEVSSARSHIPTETRGPGFSIIMTAWAGWLGDGNDALSYVEGELSERWTDVARKLIGADQDEKHALVLLVDDVVGPMWAIEEGKTPTRPPDLPDGLDGLWIVARGQFPLRGIYFLPGQEWQDVEVSPDDYRAVCDANLG